MSARPSTPSYARPTTAWKTPVTPERSSSRSQYIASPRFRKRPKFLLIKRQDPMKPCFFASLPRELRLQVYEYILPPDLLLMPAPQNFLHAMRKRLLPVLLHVCSVIRFEVAASFYGSMHFTYDLIRFDFTPLQCWLTTLTAEHRAYLERNRNITMVIRGYRRPTLEDHAELCETFGNRYATVVCVQKWVMS